MSTAAPTFHSEDEYRLVERRPLARTGDWTSHPEVRDAESAIRSTRRLVGLARKDGARIHVLHVTTAEEMASSPITRMSPRVEVTPQHLTLAGPEAYERLKGYAQMNPPIRDAATAALWTGMSTACRRAGLGPRARTPSRRRPGPIRPRPRACRGCRPWCR
jgi:dihydroorotase